MFSSIQKNLIALLISATLLSACGLGASPAPTIEAIPTATLSPTVAAPLLLLVAPAEGDPKLAAAAAEILAAYAGRNQMQFEQRSSLNFQELPANLATLVLLAPDTGVVALAAAAPQARIITIGFSPESPLANVTTLSAGGDESAVAFVAGYVAALTAEDWRAGMLYSPASANLVDDFLAGGEYFCGACSPVAPPYYEYPLAVQAGDSQNWQAAADELLAQSVRVVYLAPEMEASGAAEYLSNFGILLVGNQAPPEALAGSWIASISSDPIATLREQLPLALSGQPLGANRSLTLLNVNLAYLGLGRQANVQGVIDDLLSGFILLPSPQ